MGRAFEYRKARKLTVGQYGPYIYENWERNFYCR